MEKVIFDKNLLLNPEILKEQLVFPKDSKIAIKMHMGEENNKTCLRAEDVKPIVDVLLELGTKPFIIDTPVSYKGGRHTCEAYLKTAKDNGFSEETIGCPIVISNDYHEVRTEYMDFQVCKELYETEYMIVLSHVKGHCCTGFGGAIKNLSMGGATIKSKRDMHSLGKPDILKECSLCGICEKNCPAKCIKIDDKLNINLDGCWGCGVCVVNCPEKILKPKTVLIDELLAEGAWASVQNKKKILCINMIKRITKLCDCESDSGKIIAPDVGVLFSSDPVAIDQASIDLVGDAFLKENHKDPQLQIDYSEKLGFGGKDYELVKV
ncbi:MAG: DUF362 domain-containing protein [archaeon]